MTKRKLLTIIAGFALGAMTTFNANAAIFTIDADNFAENAKMCVVGNEAGCFGTKLSSHDEVIKSETPDYGLPITGSRIMGGDAGSNDWSSFEFIRADFSHTNIFKVSIDIRESDDDEAQGTLQAYDAFDNPIGLADQSDILGADQLETLMVMTNTPIAYVVVSIQTSYINIDNLVFETVDAPTGLSMMMLGLMGVGYAAYRRKKA